VSSPQSAGSDPSAPQSNFQSRQAFGLYFGVADGVEWSFSAMILIFLT
jgi:hypothetical protein